MNEQQKKEFRSRLEAKYAHYKPLIGAYMKELIEFALEVAESMETEET